MNHLVAQVNVIMPYSTCPAVPMQALFLLASLLSLSILPFFLEVQKACLFSLLDIQLKIS
jgi:hypothetical protein